MFKMIKKGVTFMFMLAAKVFMTCEMINSFQYFILNVNFDIFYFSIIMLALCLKKIILNIFMLYIIISPTNILI